ncbi:hypothetical protein ASPZODRAFT_67164 [Penicilliopsis zonata CBS 506.65]|uniref:Carboxylic ester hydrolase n=1 Tax=Penicilliopsis zonata CBS 506.65 TaxID=1073090 RepID=A0A1L9SG57_9EURO|nr:hypothetical protein ASPZODRAFT_67164 [Penicilliopsis zonata CBS 506.65]OJJ46014.1 hypothetical protein ASPZODRAFT_67164 [Penicilliopsis zonata CBS 506.65]
MLGLTVDTTIGSLYGLVNGSTPSVAQFLGIPFAQPPLGDLRFAPPQPATVNRTAVYDATRQSPNCPQYPLTVTTDPSVYTIDSPWLQPYGPWSEDCLTLDVYAPLNANREDDALPVLIWLFGGGFYEGGLITNGFDGAPWVERTQEHIVVAVNYRNNIFGFPNAAGLAETGENLNLGLLDQRLAVEWLRDNIASFGGDPTRMTLWGQSSGAASVDYFNFAWPDDPIVQGLIMHSGSVFATGASVDVSHSNFTFMADSLGCGGLSPADELACMRHNVTAEALIDLYENYTLGADDPALKFTTIVDNVTKFENFTERALAGNYSKLPAILGTNANEEASLLPWVGPEGYNQSYIHYHTLETDQCPANYYNGLRYNTSSLTFRWYNMAYFPNTSPRPWEKAYHASELPLLFGTYPWYGGSATELQHQVSRRWQDLYLAFLKDPVNALPQMGWPAYEPEGHALVFGRNGSVSGLMPMEELYVGCDQFPLPSQ